VAFIIYHVYATNARGLINGEHVKMWMKKGGIGLRKAQKTHVSSNFQDLISNE